MTETTRKLISQPADWWEAFEQAAEASGQPLSLWLGEVAKAQLPVKTQKKLSERKPAHRPRSLEK